jgi:hypothetical protein
MRLKPHPDTTDGHTSYQMQKSMSLNLHWNQVPRTLNEHLKIDAPQACASDALIRHSHLSRRYVIRTGSSRMPRMKLE